MPVQQPLETYRTNRIETASPVQLVAMLIDRGNGLLGRAREKIGARDWDNAHVCLIKAQQVIEELDAGLDEEKGGEVATNLHRLYEFVLQRLVFANVTKTVEPVDEAAQLVDQLSEMWAQAT